MCACVHITYFFIYYSFLFLIFSYVLCFLAGTPKLYPENAIQAQFPPGMEITDLQRDLIDVLNQQFTITTKKSVTVEKNNAGTETHKRARIFCSRAGNPKPSKEEAGLILS